MKFLGIIGDKSYPEILALQQSLFEERVGARAGKKALREDVVLFVEHRPVYTLGRHAKAANLHLAPAELSARHIELHEISRGGDITYHGPGQLTVYPIVDLLRYRLGVKDYVHLLERIVIEVLEEYGISAGRDPEAPGVWLDCGLGSQRKICAVGVHCRRFVTMHGFALNVGSDLSYFANINPCGFTDRGVTSISRECGCEIELADVMEKIRSAFKRNFIEKG